MKTVDFIERNFDKKIGATDLESISSMSSSTLIRNFRRYVGKTPKQVIIDIRLAKAKELLERTDLNISEIALITGFSALSHLSRSFSEKVGVTPAYYRQARKIKQRTGRYI